MTAVSNKDLMEAITSVRLELTGKIDKVDDKVNKLAIAQAVDKTKLGALMASITVVVSAVVTVVVENLRRTTG